MVPLHESDLAQDGWSKVEWENYELWEKVEVRLRRKKHLWVFVTLILFFALSSVPIVIDRWPKWTTRTIVRHLAQELNWVKREAGVHHAAYRLKLLSEGKFDFVVERLVNCDAAHGEEVKTGLLTNGRNADHYSWITSIRGVELGIPGLVSEFCYDPLDGNSALRKGDVLAGFAVTPVRDLTEKRIDRITVLLLSGTNAEISFD